MKKQQGKKITVYTTSEFMGNVIRTEGRLPTDEEIIGMSKEDKSLGYMQYAQYSKVPFVIVKPKRKQRFFKMKSAGYKPFMIVVEGWGNPEPDSLYGAPKPADKNGTTISEGRHIGFGSGWTKDFNSQIGLFLANNPGKILLDDRGRGEA